eukprot:TRINITY_DN76030_c0_g1_i1.p1 TRINITY_DN76030_c0_g1~~TRINITY_DN76030_c0_g1_i1.p1  ORF type:complete len:389 (+),score=13.34 TRINITY_DN76030_c0_g1_i1:21-1187(+)
MFRKAALRTPILQKFDSIWSTKQYHIEYNGFLTNHTAHGVVALHHLGATDDVIITKTTHYVNSKLEPAHANQDPLPKDWKTLRGTRTNFTELRDFFLEQIEQHGVDTVIQTHYPDLMHGMSGSAFHGLIHLGYGYNASSALVVAEGLAYSTFSFLEYSPTQPTPTTNKQDRTSLANILNEIAQAGTLRKTVLEHDQDPDILARKLGRFQYQMVAASLHAQPYIREMVDRVDTPWQDDSVINTEEIADVGSWLLLNTITAYAVYPVPNDFFLIHGVTSAWSLLQILHCLKPADRAEAIRSHLCCLIGAFTAEGAMELISEPKFPTEQPTEEYWDAVKKRALDDKYEDEHTWKLIQVVLATKESVADPAMQPYLQLAVENCLNYPLDLGK